MGATREARPQLAAERTPDSPGGTAPPAADFPRQRCTTARRHAGSLTAPHCRSLRGWGWWMATGEFLNLGSRGGPRGSHGFVEEFGSALVNRAGTPLARNPPDTTWGGHRRGCGNGCGPRSAATACARTHAELTRAAASRSGLRSSGWWVATGEFLNLGSRGGPRGSHGFVEEFGSALVNRAGTPLAITPPDTTWDGHRRGCGNGCDSRSAATACRRTHAGLTRRNRTTGGGLSQTTVHHRSATRRLAHCAPLPQPPGLGMVDGYRRVPELGVAWGPEGVSRVCGGVRLGPGEQGRDAARQKPTGHHLGRPPPRLRQWVRLAKRGHSLPPNARRTHQEEPHHRRRTFPDNGAPPLGDTPARSLRPIAAASGVGDGGWLPERS